MRPQNSILPPPNDWDFRGADTKRMTHGLHPYPAMMIPQIAERLIDRYGAGAKKLFDPYCGTGSSLLEANIRGIDAVGTDLNPLARMIARAKTARLDCQKTDLYLRHINERLFKARMNGDDASAPAPPSIKNIDFWFSKKVQRELAVARAVISDITDDDVRRFLLVGFGETARECSYTRNGEFKLYRMKAAQMEKFSPDVFGVLMAKLTRNLKAMKEYVATVKDAGYTQVFDFNTVDGIPADILEPESADIVVTSPPYGDSRTTVAYGQFSRMANEWLGYQDAAGVDSRLMGGRTCAAKQNDPASLGCGRLDDAVGRVEKQNAARAREIKSFYRDYRSSIAHVAAAIKTGGFACYVVGNRKSKGVVLPTDEATRAYFKENGYQSAGVFTRNIPNKRMPAKNSPSNVAGDCDATMTQEFIIVMKKCA